MKKRDWLFLAGVIIVAVLIYKAVDYDNRFPDYKLEKETLTLEQALREEPELYLSEEDYALCKAVAELPEAKATKDGRIEGEVLEDKLSGVTPEGMEISYVYLRAESDFLEVSLHCVKKQEEPATGITYTFLMDTPDHVQKYFFYYDGTDELDPGTVVTDITPREEYFINENNEIFQRCSYKRVRFGTLFDRIGLGWLADLWAE